MQAVKFINPRYQEIEISRTSYPYVFESITGIDASATTIRARYPAGMDGAMFEGLALTERTPRLTLHIKGRSREHLYQAKQELINRLSSSYSARGRQGQLWYENDHGKWWIPAVVRQGPVQIGKRIGNNMTVQVVFYCPDGDWRADRPIRARQAFIAGGFKFPLVIPHEDEPMPGIMFGSRGYRALIDNTGDRPTPIEITITGPATEPTVTNEKTGEYLAVIQPLAEGDKLTISTQKGEKQAYITHPDGSVTNAMGWIEPGSVWFQLDPGENELKYTSGDDTTTATSVITAWPRLSGV